MAASTPYTPLRRHTEALAIALGYRDPCTQLHSEHVLGMARQLGRHISLDAQSLEILEIAAAFHDIGKIALPDHILLNSGDLDQIEWQIMQQHIEAGENIIATIQLEGAREVATIIRHHHERFDGKGFPDRLAGEAIPVTARIIGIIDSYDALGAPHRVHSPRTHEEVMGMLARERNGKHDPWLLDRFREIIGTSEFRL